MLLAQDDPIQKSSAGQTDCSVLKRTCLTPGPHCHASEEAASDGWKSCPWPASEVFKPWPSELGIGQGLVPFKVLLMITITLPGSRRGHHDEPAPRGRLSLSGIPSAEPPRAPCPDKHLINPFDENVRSG